MGFGGTMGKSISLGIPSLKEVLKNFPLTRISSYFDILAFLAVKLITSFLPHATKNRFISQEFPKKTMGVVFLDQKKGVVAAITLSPTLINTISAN